MFSLNIYLDIYMYDFFNINQSPRILYIGITLESLKDTLESWMRFGLSMKYSYVELNTAMNIFVMQR
jgi:hypothetical protein